MLVPSGELAEVPWQVLAILDDIEPEPGQISLGFQSKTAIHISYDNTLLTIRLNKVVARYILYQSE